MRIEIYIFISKIVRMLPVLVRIPVRFCVNITRIVIWCLSGMRIPPPYAYKMFTLLIYATKYKSSIFVETGTYEGDTLDFLRIFFKRLFSVELDDRLFKNANDYFENSRNIEILHGDSAKLLPKILKELKEPTLFWLDAHYSGEGTARGDKDTPIMKELTNIKKNMKFKHVVLIDDARLFIGKDSYPKLKWFVAYIQKNWKDYKVEVKNDIIRITPC